jgi:cobyrinic acid a,c-diamide synthase
MLTTDIPRVVIAGAASNVGKTTVTAGLIAALRQRGLRVQPFKCGPDYIDPSYHERAAGRPCRNLDTWMLTDGQLLESFARACQDVDIAVVEGVMGLYDGSDWHAERGSTAQIAKVLQAPVLLVLDISGSARSAAAAVLGYQSFDPAVALAGVILNFAGSERHARGCAEAIGHRTSLPMLGWLPRDLQLRIPERHLGLVPGAEQANSDALVSGMAAAVNGHFDVAGIVEVARRAAGRDAGRLRAGGCATGTGGDAIGTGGGAIGTGGGACTEVGGSRGAGTQVGRNATRHPTIAVARDEAFCFYYPENLELLVEAGARIAFFSPLRGECPPPNTAGVYLGGGYPELHGPALANNTTLWQALRDLHAADTPIYAECGGFMVLTEALVDAEGRSWPMAGLLPGVARMTGKLAALGYRHATALRENMLAEAGESLRGHEFRYSAWERGGAVGVREDATRVRGEARRARDDAGDGWDTTAAWEVRGTRGDTPVEAVGYAQGNLLASYLHVHFGQRPELARRFVHRMR